MIKISKENYEKIISREFSELPNEAFGLIAGKIDGVFAAIGMEPKTDLIKDFVDFDSG